METEELNTANRLKEATPYGKVDGLPDGIAPAKAMRDEIIEQQDDFESSETSSLRTETVSRIRTQDMGGAPLSDKRAFSSKTKKEDSDDKVKLSFNESPLGSRGPSPLRSEPDAQ